MHSISQRILGLPARVVSSARHHVEQRAMRVHFSRSERTAIFDICKPGMGLFAHFSWLVAAADWSEQRNHNLHFLCTNAQYNKAGARDDWLRVVLSQKSPSGGPRFRITEYADFPFGHSPFMRDRAYTSSLFVRHFTIPRELLEWSDSWISRTFPNSIIIGLHYRGTDKFIEAPRMGYETALSSVNRIIADLRRRGIPSIGVFVATDDANFLPVARAEIRGATVGALDANVRSTSTTGAHNLGLADGHSLALQAMRDAILLSKTHTIIKTASLLSAWSALFNPAAPVLLLSRPYEHAFYFPDSALAKECFTPGQEEALAERVRASIHLPK